MQGAGWLTTEELVWDDKGRCHPRASTYKIPACSDRPDVFNVDLWVAGKPRRDDLSLQGGGRAAVHAGHLGILALSDAVAACGDGIPRARRPATPERIAEAVGAECSDD